LTADGQTRSFADYDDFFDDLVYRGASDGLPVIPPSPARIDAALAAAGLDGSDVLGEIPTRDVVVDARRAAINAVMAGCLPEYMPVVAAAVRAWTHPLANGHGTTGSLAGPTNPIIVNGPIARALGFNGGAGCLGPGSRANLTVGRALRLIIRNVAMSIPGFADRAAYSQPGRFSFCLCEDETSTTWNPLHVERGYRPEDSVATVHSNTDIFTYRSEERDPERLLDGLVTLARARPVQREDFVGLWRTIVLLIGPDHREVLERNGWSKARVRDYLHPRLTRPDTFGPDARVVWGSQPTGSVGEYSFFIPNADNVLLVAAGGRACYQSLVLYPHVSSTVSAQVTFDGSRGRLVPDDSVVSG
jgi:hypothetical protein